MRTGPPGSRFSPAGAGRGSRWPTAATSGPRGAGGARSRRRAGPGAGTSQAGRRRAVEVRSGAGPAGRKGRGAAGSPGAGKGSNARSRPQDARPGAVRGAAPGRPAGRGADGLARRAGAGGDRGGRGQEPHAGRRSRNGETAPAGHGAGGPRGGLVANLRRGDQGGPRGLCRGRYPAPRDPAAPGAGAALRCRRPGRVRAARASPGDPGAICWLWGWRPGHGARCGWWPATSRPTRGA